MKKCFALLLALALAGSLAACGVQKNPRVIAKEGATGVECQQALDQKAQLPVFTFKAVLDEAFDENNSYFLVVKADKADFDAYIKALGKVGYQSRLQEEYDDYFEGANDEGFEVSVSLTTESEEMVILVYPS